ncbi:MAG TPA: hypothetical protein VHV10_02640 [Ktedonobacteraceae bacterium]|jgi:hypothetical protein|nr:hypothetical protein [Ktedonobacteraceae bacterium]
MKAPLAWTKEAVTSMLEYEVAKDHKEFTRSWSQKHLQQWLTWVAICHEVMRGNQSYIQRYNLTVSEAASQYMTIRNLFTSSGWTLTYVPAKRGFSARIQ